MSLNIRICSKSILVDDIIWVSVENIPRMVEIISTRLRFQVS